MTTLVFPLAGTIQAWGTVEQGTVRPTDRYPSKSGVVGFLAAALGRDRSQSLNDLNDLGFAVRVDLAGKPVRDYQTVRKRVPKVRDPFKPVAADDEPLELKKGEPTATITYRDYLADAVFVVAVSGSDALIRELDRALIRPVYPLFLGRRNCVPFPFRATVFESDSPVEVLSRYPYQGFSPIESEARRGKLRNGEYEVPAELDVIADARLAKGLKTVAVDEVRDIVTYRHDRARRFSVRGRAMIRIPTPVSGEDTPPVTTSDFPLGAIE